MKLEDNPTSKQNKIKNNATIQPPILWKEQKNIM